MEEEAADLERAVAILIKALRGLAQGEYGSIRKGFWIRMDEYLFKYRPYWSDSDYVPSNRATYLVYEYIPGWFNRKLGKVKFDDGQYMSAQVQRQIDMDIKDELEFIEACNQLADNVEMVEEEEVGS